MVLKDGERKRGARAVAFAAGALIVGVALTGCAELAVPADPDGSLERIEGNVLRAGASLHTQLVEQDGEEAEGPLAELVEEFASEHDAEVEWRFGSEEMLVTSLEEGELDLVVGGITADTPWVDRAAVTREHQLLTVAGDRHPVVLLPLGENRLLLEFERFIDERVTP